MAISDEPGVPRRFEYEAGASRKYWVVTRMANVLLIHSGRMGTKGIWTTSPYATEQVAIATQRDRIREKVLKGYCRVEPLPEDVSDLKRFQPLSQATGSAQAVRVEPVGPLPSYRPRGRSRSAPPPPPPERPAVRPPADVVYDPLD